MRSCLTAPFRLISYLLTLPFRLLGGLLRFRPKRLWRAKARRGVNLVGESHYQDNLRRICGRPKAEGERKPVRVRLQPEPNNPADKHAIRAQINWMTVGYLSRENARTYAKRVGKGITVDGLITGGWDRGKRGRGSYGVKVYL